MTHPAQSKSLTTNQRCAGSGGQAAQTSCPTLSTFKKMESTGTQSRHENESYADYMSRLYKAPSINYRNLKRDSSGQIVQYSGKTQRPLWAFRPPLDLAKDALKFMREQDMSVTTYLTYAMHNLHNNQKNG